MVRFENVGLRYGLGPEILRDLTFLIPAHSFQFLTGPSGAGKTSLLRLLFLSLRPTRGLVNLFGQDVSLLGKDQVANMRQRIGIVLQDFRLLDHMTTYENVALPFRVMGREESSYRREVIELQIALLQERERLRADSIRFDPTPVVLIVFFFSSMPTPPLSRAETPRERFTMAAVSNPTLSAVNP